MSVSFCQNANKELSCSIGAQAKPMSLKEHKFIKSVNEFAPWPSIYPNKIRKKNGQPEILTSRILCRPNTVSKNLNSVTIAQRRGFHVVWVKLSQTACEKLAIWIPNARIASDCVEKLQFWSTVKNLCLLENNLENLARGSAKFQQWPFSATLESRKAHLSLVFEVLLL